MDCQVNGAHLENNLKCTFGAKLLFWLYVHFGAAGEDSGKGAFLFREAETVGPL